MRFATMGAHHVLFKDRREAGRELVPKLEILQGKPVCVLGIARGGVSVAAEVSSALRTALDVLVIKKLSSPLSREYALGAVAPDTVSIVHWKEVHSTGVEEAYVRQEIRRLSGLIDESVRLYRKGKKPFDLRGKTVVLVDDGAATGATMEVAVLWARKRSAHRIVVALPVCSHDAAARIRPEVSSLVTLHEGDLGSVGEFYTAFPQVSDEEVLQLLHT